MQDYAALGITDISDRKKIFGLIQMLRKESLGGPERLRLVTSASTMTTSSSNSGSGLRQPTSYYHRSNTYQDGLSAAYSPTSPNPMQSRLPQLQSNIPSMDHGQYTRMRRQSTVQMPNKPPSSPARPVRSRTMSDAGSSLPRCTPSATTTTTTRKPDLRRSVLAPDSFISNFNTISSDEEDEDEEEMAPRRYRASAPMLNAYGMPTSSSAAAVKSRRSIGALKSASAAQQSRLDNLPPSDLDQKIRVCVRKRPLNKKETERCEKDIAETIGTRSILINEPK